MAGRKKKWLAEQAKLSVDAVSSWLRGGRNPSQINIDLIAQILAVDSRWLATGEGSPYIKESGASVGGYRIEYDDDQDYPSFSEWLADEDLQDLCNPSEEEIEELRAVRFRNRQPDKRGWTDILISLRRAKKKRED